MRAPATATISGRACWPAIWGGTFRADRANLSDDSGFGWYVGGGLNLMLNERWALGVSVTYERVSMRDETKSLLLGIGLSYHY